MKNGKPVGVPIFRIDGAHNGASAPHLSANHQLYPNLKNLDHTEIPQSVYNLAKNGNKLTKIAKTGGKALAVAGIAGGIGGALGGRALGEHIVDKTYGGK